MLLIDGKRFNGGCLLAEEKHECFWNIVSSSAHSLTYLYNTFSVALSALVFD